MLTRIFATLAIALAAAGCTNGHDELGHKDDYAFLQSAALEWQSSPLEDGTLLVRDEESGRCAAGVVSEESRRVWILLNHESDVLRVPDLEVALDPEDLGKIVGFCEPSAAVLESLDRTSDAGS